MIRNYFKIAWRNIWKSKTYSFLNIFGLAVGIACASLIFLWVQDELSYDDSIPNKENLQIVRTKQTYEGVSYSFAATPGPLAAALKADVPEIVNVARISFNHPVLFSLDDKSIYEGGYYADPSIIDMFSLKFIAGNPQTALNDIYSTVISESMARRFFNDTQVVGKTLKLNRDEEYTISGVIEDLPPNTTYRFDWLIPFANYERGQDWLKTWGNNGVGTLTQLDPSADIASVNDKIYEFIEEKTNGATTWSKTFLYPMSRWHLYNSFDSDGNEQEGRVQFVRLFSIIAWVVLIIACINFMNLATARSDKRAKEVGVRKVVGAEKQGLRIQFLCESVLMAFLSAVLAMGIVWLSLNSFNALVNKELSLNLFDPVQIGALALLILTTGFLAGSYPAFYLSSFHPAQVLKGARLKIGSAGFIRKGLVVLQFSSAIVLIICTIIVYQQIQHVKNRDMGYNREQVITTALTETMSDHLDVIKEDLKRTGFVSQVGLSNSNILMIGSNTSGVHWEGKDPGKDILVGLIQANEGLLSTTGMELRAGRNFRDKLVGDSLSVLVNESLAEMIQKGGDVVGKTVSWDTTYTIAGVVKNFVYNDMYSSAEPLLIYPYQKSSAGLFYLKINPKGDMQEAVSKIGEVMKAHNPGYPFEFNFLDEQFDNQFKTETMIQDLASVFAILSIIISCLGLFGLAAYTAEQRTKEIGVRKVLGASVASLANLLSREFVQLVFISCLIAFPIAWLVMSKWLSKYNYHIDVQWWVFVMAGTGALLLALLTVSSQAVKAAVVNPVKSLRTE